MLTIKQGDVVTVINQTLAGKPFVEGRAKVLAVEDDEPRPRCRVIFENGDVVHRWVDPEMQDMDVAAVQRMLDNP